MHKKITTIIAGLTVLLMVTVPATAAAAGNQEVCTATTHKLCMYADGKIGHLLDGKALSTGSHAENTEVIVISACKDIHHRPTDLVQYHPKYHDFCPFSNHGFDALEQGNPIAEVRNADTGLCFYTQPQPRNLIQDKTGSGAFCQKRIGGFYVMECLNLSCPKNLDNKNLRFGLNSVAANDAHPPDDGEYICTNGAGKPLVIFTGLNETRCQWKFN